MPSSISTIIVADTETTGIDPTKDSLLEIAHVVVERSRVSPLAWTITGGEGTLIEFEGLIPPEARAVHHISPEMVKPGSGAEARDVVLHGMVCSEVSGEMCYGAHNAPFDAGFLPELDLPWIDTYKCAKHIWPDAPKFSNQVLRYWLGVEPPAHLIAGLESHRALYDAAVTAVILLEMLKLHTPEKLLELSTKPILLKKISFGKHKDQLWSDVPKDYLRWLRDKSDMMQTDADIAHTVRHYLGNLV